MTEITIIIPTYNAEKYIIRCLDSIIKNNKFSKLIEILIINDCSTDNTINLIEAFSKENPNIDINIINLNKNIGSDNAKNIGIKKSKGKYIYFMDNDDMVNPDVLLEMYNHLEKYNNNTCMCKFLNFDDDGIFQLNSTKDKYINIDKDMINCNIYDYPNLIMISPVAWVYLIRKDFLLKYNISFKNKMYGIGDVKFTHELHYYDRNFSIINKVGYYYYDNSEGTLNNIKVEAWDKLFKNVYIPMILDNRFDDKYKKFITYNMFENLPYNYIKYPKNFLIMFDSIKEYLDNDILIKLKNEYPIHYMLYMSLLNK